MFARTLENPWWDLQSNTQWIWNFESNARFWRKSQMQFGSLDLGGNHQNESPPETHFFLLPAELSLLADSISSVVGLIEKILKH